MLQLQLTQETTYILAAGAAVALACGFTAGYFFSRGKRKATAITKTEPQLPPAPTPAQPLATLGGMSGEALPELLPSGARLVTESNLNDLFGLYHVFGSRTAAQQFLAVGETLREVAVKAYRIGAPSSLVFEVRPDAGDVPAEEVLASQSVAGSTLTTNYSGDWAAAVVPCQLAKGAKYWIVAKVENKAGDAKNKVVVKGVYRDAYHEGISAESLDYGSSWEKHQYSDIAFKAVMQATEAAPSPQEPSQALSQAPEQQAT